MKVLHDDRLREPIGQPLREGAGKRVGKPGAGTVRRTSAALRGSSARRRAPRIPQARRREQPATMIESSRDATCSSALCSPSNFDFALARPQPYHLHRAQRRGVHMITKFCRGLVAALVLGIPAWVPTADAQTRTFRVGHLHSLHPSPFHETYWRRLRELGFSEGKNLVVEHRYAAGNEDAVPALAAELVRLGVDVILTTSIGATRAAKARPSAFRSWPSIWKPIQWALDSLRALRGRVAISRGLPRCRRTARQAACTAEGSGAGPRAGGGLVESLDGP